MTARRRLISLPQLDDANAEAIEHIAYNSGEFYAPSPSSQSACTAWASRSVPLRNDRIDVGLSALRAMGAAVAGAESIAAARPPLPWREAEAPRLRRGSKPRVGSLLVTHPIACLGQPTLHHAVILLTHVDAERVQGVVRNRRLDWAKPPPSAPPPTPRDLRRHPPLSATQVLNKQVETRLGSAVVPSYRGQLGPLASAVVYQGGDVAEGRLSVLHGDLHGRCDDLRGEVASPEGEVASPGSESHLPWSTRRGRPS